VIVPITVVHYHMGDKGWKFVGSDTELEGSSPDPLYHSKFLRDLYFRAEPEYEGRFTVPMLWDKKTETIVNNESRFTSLVVLNLIDSEIIRMFYTEFDSILPKEKQGVTFYPSKLAKEIDEVNDWVYDTVNNGFQSILQWN